MDAKELARQANGEGSKFLGVLANTICQEIALARVAKFLDQQDEQTLAAFRTATDAIALIRAFWFRQ